MINSEKKKQSQLRVYVFVRTDIPIVDQLVQVAHSALLAGASFSPEEDTYIVMCQVKNEEELIDISKLLDEEDIEHEIFYEPCNARGFCLGFTSIATKPIEKLEHSKVKLWTDNKISDILKQWI